MRAKTNPSFRCDTRTSDETRAANVGALNHLASWKDRKVMENVQKKSCIKWACDDEKV